jgi:polyketide biosynthesis enoyl-CoA hydratase PksI
VVSGLVEARLGGPVAVLRLADTVGRNAFTPALEAEFSDALDRAVTDPASRVVLLAGLADVFCVGGSRETLLADPDGQLTLNYDLIVRAPLRCPLPVVAAMRGHAIGGGLLFGLYSDVPVLSERSVYVANFLSYGFSPCMGATWVLPNRLGPVLGAEVLLAAARHRGRELRQRGAPLRVVPHDEVEQVAGQLAAQIAGAPRLALEHAKAALAAPWLLASDQAFQREVDGHLETLRQPGVQRKVAAEYTAGPAGGTVR